MICRHGRDIELHPCERCEERIVVIDELDRWLSQEIARGYYTGDSSLEAALQANSRVRRLLKEMK